MFYVIVFGLGVVATLLGAALALLFFDVEKMKLENQEQQAAERIKVANEKLKIAREKQQQAFVPKR